MKKIIQMMLLIILMFTLTSCFGNKEENIKVENNNEIENKDDNGLSEKEIIDIKNEMKNDMVDISQKVLDGEISNEEAQKAMFNSIDKSGTLNSMIEKQKEQMPKMLKILKENLKCLEGVDNKSDTKDCSDNSNKLAKKYGIMEMYDDEDFEWNQSEKPEIIKELKQAVKNLEEMLPCIEKAEKITDFMKCNPENNL